MPEHPVAVKYHFKYGQSKPYTAQERILETKLKEKHNIEEKEREKGDTGIHAGRRKIEGIKKAIFKYRGERMFPDFNKAIEILEDYNNLVHGQVVNEESLDEYLRKGYKALHDSFPGDIKPTSDRKTKEAITIQKLIISAKSYTDKVIAFDSLMHAHHTSGSYLGEMYPSLDDENVDEKILEFLNLLAKK